MNLLAELRRRFHRALEGLCDDPSEYTSMVRPAQDGKFGDFQANCAMPLGKKTGRPPRDIAQEIVDRLQLDDLGRSPRVLGVADRGTSSSTSQAPTWPSRCTWAT